MNCPSCRYENVSTARLCGLCGKVLSKIDPTIPSPPEPTRPIRPPTQLEQLRQEKSQRAEDREERIKERRKSHAITGAITFFILFTLGGLPLSMLPLGLISNALISVLIGFPVGYLISRYRGGIVRGAMISSAVCIVVLLLCSLSSVMLDGSSFEWPIAFARSPGAAAAWMLPGGLPGALIGLHVESDV